MALGPLFAPRLTTSSEERIAAFEQAWNPADPASMEAALAGVEDDQRWPLLLELVLIDMELRWQSAAEGQTLTDALGSRPGWRDYAQAFPRFGDLQAVPAELLAEEYRLGLLWGEPSNHLRFAAQFPWQLQALRPLLEQVDAELAADGIEPLELEPSPRTERFNFDPRAPLPWSDYLLQEHVGGGGFGKVYRAWQKSLGRAVAVKALLKSRQRNLRAIEQFIHEAQCLARLRHPGIIGVHGLGRFPSGGYFLVLDWISGGDLQQRIKHGPLPCDEAVRITIATAEAIQHAHDQDVIHGDLKPGNVLIDATGRVVVSDFGLAQLLPRGSTVAASLRPFAGGTLAYLAPELAEGAAPSICVDIYGLGALLLALLTGEPPQSVVLPSSLPAPLSVVIQTCLATEPARRYGEASQVAAALADWQREA